MKVWNWLVAAGAALALTVVSFGVTKAAPVKVKTLYKIQSKALQLKKGKAAKAGFQIVLLKKGTKVHPQAPFRCKVSASKGLKLSKNKLGHDDKVIAKNKKQVTVQVGVVANATGKKSVQMNCSFFVCTKDICARTSEKVKIAANVK